MLALFLIVTLVLVVAVAVVLMAQGILRPPRMTDGKAAYVLKRLSPANLGMGFDAVTFVVGQPPAPKVELAAWWIPHPAGGDRTVVLVHGYADAKVGSIAWAPIWRALGYHILAIDLRAHGESTGAYCSAGFHERHDLDQVINHWRAAKPQQTQSVVLFGASMGGAIAIATAELRDDIDAVVADCPYAHFGHAAAAHAELKGLPLVRLQPLVLRVAQWMCGADFDEVAPIRIVPTLQCPLMLIQSDPDPFVSPADLEAFARAVELRQAIPTSHWRPPGAEHLQAMAQFPEEYRQRISDFLDTVHASRQSIASPE
jgi:pimeloyl-ACP methyl ester carboxylesterase